MPNTVKKPMTFSAVIATVKASKKLAPTRRSEIASGIKRFCETAGFERHSTIAEPAAIRKGREKANWQQAGLTKARWQNICSLVSAGLEIAGIRVHRSRANYPVSPEWQNVLDSLSKIDRRDLRRFAGWCTALSISPSDVNQNIFERFLAYCVDEMVHRNPRERWHVARRAWNRAAASGNWTGFPTIDAPELHGRKGMAWANFPASLREDFDDFVAASKGKKVSGKKKPGLRPATIANYQKNVRLFATCLVELGIPATSLTSLEVLVTAANFENGLEQYLGDDELDEARPRVSAMATTLMSIARYLREKNELSSEAHAAMKDIYDTVRYHQPGLSAKNRERLNQFRSNENVTTLYRLPQTVFDELATVKEPKVRHAQEAQMAVLLMILCQAPVRISNAAAIDLDKHVCKLTGENGHEWLLQWAGVEVKNGVALTHHLPTRCVTLLERYIAQYRPLLMAEPTTLLFTGQNGGGKLAGPLGKQLSSFIKRRTGFIVNPHLLRHLTAYLYLRKHPGAYVTVQRMLGHKNLQTTLDFYTGMETDHDHVAFDEMILDLMAAQKPDPKHPHGDYL